MRTLPGGWVDGIGWVARRGDLTAGDWYRPADAGLSIRRSGAITIGWWRRRRLVVVVKWADGSEPQRVRPA